MTTKIKFGTDGWRAIIAEDFTFDNVRACAQGVANYLKQNNLTSRSIVIGYDTRFASEDFAAAAAEVLAANGIKTLLCPGAAPTPVISYAVPATNSTGGIIITASHNPGCWNGFKYKDSYGASAPTELVSEIEKQTNEAIASGHIKRVTLTEGLSNGKIAYYDPLPVYNRQLEKLIDIKAIKQARLKIAIDSMYGAGMGFFPAILGNGNIQFIQMNAQRNPLFPGIQPEPIARHLTGLSELVKKQKADIGIANDGDADRIGIMDEKGNFLNPHQVFALLALYFLEVHGEKRPIVKSLCSTTMLDMLGKLYNVPVYETAVGFKYVAPVMIDKDAFIGGEESGGYGFRGHVPERDGILAGLYFLDFMIKTGKTPSQLVELLFSKVGPHYYDRYDFHILPEQHKALLNQLSTGGALASVAGLRVARLNRTDGFKYILDDDSWLLIRFSGTEPLIRIYAEGHNPEQVKKLLDFGKDMLGL
jgi:alpha-D-glucose phosphate-specific phosphoglucomutase